MDYDDIDYDEGYSIRDIDNNWLNCNMDYEDTDYDNDTNDYNYNNSTNNSSTLTGNSYNNSFLDRINKKIRTFRN